MVGGGDDRYMRPKRLKKKKSGTESQKPLLRAMLLEKPEIFSPFLA